MSMTGQTLEPQTSPMMVQWHACKKIAKEAVLLFRMGDFYEAFYADAALIARELDLTLTARQGIPMSGVPSHTFDAYVDRLVGKGYRVAVAEQMEDPRKVKGLVKREVVRIVTPATVVNSHLLSDKSNNYFAAIHQVGQRFGFALLDLTTSEFRVIEFDNLQDLAAEFYRFRPSECLVSTKFTGKHPGFLSDLREQLTFLLSTEEEWKFDHALTYGALVDQFKVHSLDGFGLHGMTVAINAAGALLQYLQDNLCLSVEHIRELQPYSTSQFMSLDPHTQRNLELTESLKDGSRKHTLLEIIDHTLTPMGGRLMTRWVKQPLLSAEAIHARQDAVEELMRQPRLLEELRQWLEQVRDLERLTMKVCSGYASPRDLVALRTSLEPLPHLSQCLNKLTSSLIIQEKIEPIPEVTTKLAQALVDNPPLRISEGDVFREGFHPELDQLRLLSGDGKNWIAQYQNRVREETGIKTLKVGYNRISGYFIEVSKGQVHLMPDLFQRRQTLVNGERFISPELKEYESKVLTAQEQIEALENELFIRLREEISHYATRVMAVAQSIARVDAIQSLAQVAARHGYVRPLVDEGPLLEIRDGRHPVIESANLAEKFVPNDVHLDNELERLHLITGPNMAGKSTFIRQVALLTILAQIGSFVPASQAHIGVVDKVFTRIGASDDLSRGQSTFMVEMTETANILHNATDRSLVILDEIGRGTSTYDGISIAWAVAEYLLTTPGKQAKTLFATHYWELTELEKKIPGAMNYNVAVKESPDRIVFLRKIVKGGTDKSYGIHVAALAGLPATVIRRSKEILEHLEDNRSSGDPKRPTVKRQKSEVQFLLFDLK